MKKLLNLSITKAENGYVINSNGDDPTDQRQLVATDPVGISTAVDQVITKALQSATPPIVLPATPQQP